MTDLRMTITDTVEAVLTALEQRMNHFPWLKRLYRGLVLQRLGLCRPLPILGLLLLVLGLCAVLIYLLFIAV